MDLVKADRAVGHLVAPSSIAIIGASSDPLKPAGRTVRYLQKYGYSGDIFPINPTREEVFGLRCYPSVEALPVVPELAVVALSASNAADAVESCGRLGVAAAIVFASGFGELDAQGLQLQDELLEAARRSGIRLLGPNCNGVVGVASGTAATFMSGIDDESLTLRDDGVAFVSQSGAMGAFILKQAQSSGLGVGRFFSTGNEADISLPEILAGLVRDESTKVMLGYVEGVRAPAELRTALDEAQRRGVPVCLMKVGRSVAGAAAAASHTGALAGQDVVFDGVLAQYGALRAQDLDSLLDVGRIFAFAPAPAGRRMSIVTLSGGAGVLLTDGAADHHLEVPRWDDEWAGQLRKVLPPFAAVRNPIDVTGALINDCSLLRKALEVAIRHPDTDIIVVMLGNMQTQEAEACQILADAAATTDKPVVTVWVGGTGNAIGLLAAHGLAAFPEPMRAVRAVAALADYHHPRQRALSRTAGNEAPAEDVGALDEAAGKELLRRHGIPTVREAAVTSAEEAVAAADELGYPAVVKLLSVDVLHKSDQGFVAVGLNDAKAVGAAAARILSSAQASAVSDRRLVVQPMVASQTELILGMRHDATFGPAIVLGTGGVLAEVAADVQVRLPPLRHDEALRMMDELRYTALLQGVRGKAAVDRSALARTIVAFSDFVVAEGHRYDSVEINPLMIDASGQPVAVDALVILRPLDVSP
jgi:acyl-CoA synthetase (NDP forming)